jgi:hypothetical protein
MACEGDDVDLDWVYGNAVNILTVTWTFIDTKSTEKIIMTQVLGGPTNVVNNYNVVHKSNGGIPLTDVTLMNTGSYRISVNYISNSPPDDDTVSVTVKGNNLHSYFNSNRTSHLINIRILCLSYDAKIQIIFT